MFERASRVAGIGGLLCLLLAVAAPAFAAEPLQADKLAERVRSGRLHFDVVLGRILARSQSGGSYTTESSSNDRREKLEVRNTPTLLLVKYELSTKTETLSVDVTDSNQVQIRLTGAGESDLMPVEFVQMPGKAIALSVGAEAAKVVYQAPSIWHLLLTEPEISQKHLLPLIQVLQPGADLAKNAADLEKELLALAGDGGLPDPQRWEALVAQLGNDQFSERQKADRLLRQAGPLAMIYLRSLNPTALDAEQRFRIRRILAAQTSGNDVDNPREIARWLASDSQIWLAMLNRPDESTRRVAARWLTWIFKEPLAFDPAADADTRRAQIEQLRRTIAGQGNDR